MADSTIVISTSTSTCLGRTCLKWADDGELTTLDLHLVLERLARVDQEVNVLLQDTLTAEPSPSIG